MSASVLELSRCSGNSTLPHSSTERVQPGNAHLILSLVPPSPSLSSSLSSSCPSYSFSSLLFHLIPSSSFSSFSSSPSCIVIFFIPICPPPSSSSLSFPPLKRYIKNLSVIKYHAYVSVHRYVHMNAGAPRA